MNSKNMMEQPPEKAGPGKSRLDDRERRLIARRYAWQILSEVLEVHEYRSTTMPWPIEEHPAVMCELGKIRDTLFVVSGSLK